MDGDSTTVTTQRWKLVLAAIGIALLGAVLLVFGGEGLVILFRGFADPRPVIVSDRTAVASVILGVLAFGIAALFVVSRPVTRWQEQRDLSDRDLRGTKRFLMFLLACIATALVATPIQFALVDQLASDRGYRLCPTIEWPRHQPDRWALPGVSDPVERCPREGASPNE